MDNTAQSAQENSTFECGILTLRGMLFGFPEIEFMRPISPALGDTAKVVCVPNSVASLIQNYDKDEIVFHIISYPDHAEVWQSKDWRESNALRAQTREASTLRVATFNKDNAKLSALITKLHEQGYGARPGFAEQLAGQIYQDWQSGKYNSVLKLLNLMDILNEENKDTNDTTKQ